MIDVTEFKNWLLINGSAKESVETHCQKVKTYFRQYETLTQENLNSFFTSKLEKWNGSSFNVYINAIKHYSSFIKMELEFPRYRKIETKVMQYATEKEFDEILAKLPLLFNNYTKIRAMLILMLETGCRPKEIKQLKREDFNFKEKNIIIKKTKTFVERQPPISDFLCKLLQDAFQQEAEITNAFNLTPKGLSYIFRRINECMGLKKKLSPYSMRRIYAHNMIAKGLKLTSLQVGMGHKNITTTLGYLKVSDEEANEEIRKILNKKRR